MSILPARSYYKPFEFPWMYEIWKRHEASHWLPNEVEFREDIAEWNGKATPERNLTPSEKNLLTHLFRFFTQADIDVASGYCRIYLPAFAGTPEATMMMSSFAARESIHIDAYSTLIETVGMPETTYSAFGDFVEMRDKHEFVSGFHGDTPLDLLKSLAVYSGFTEGMQLFSSFAILMNFERNNKMKSMSNIVRWSIRDESMHVEGMTRLFRMLWGRYFGPGTVHVVEDGDFARNPMQKAQDDIATVAKQMVVLEDKFIELCFEQGGITGLTADEVKQYIRYIANRRWQQLGFSGELYAGVRNPLQWLDWVINGTEHTNFFEARPTEYSKATMTKDEVKW